MKRYYDSQKENRRFEPYRTTCAKIAIVVAVIRRLVAGDDGGEKDLSRGSHEVFMGKVLANITENAPNMPES